LADGASFKAIYGAGAGAGWEMAATISQPIAPRLRIKQ
jgi:hypothetical protein